MRCRASGAPLWGAKGVEELGSGRGLKDFKDPNTTSKFHEVLYIFL